MTTAEWIIGGVGLILIALYWRFVDKPPASYFKGVPPTCGNTDTESSDSQ